VISEVIDETGLIADGAHYSTDGAASGFEDYLLPMTTNPDGTLSAGFRSDRTH